MPGPQPKPYKPHLLTRWDHWRGSWVTLVCCIAKLVTFARWLPQWEARWKMAVVEKRMNDREKTEGAGAQSVNISLVGDTFGRTQVRDLIEEINDAVADGARLRIV